MNTQDHDQMRNRFTVTIEFSFRGETFELKAEVDLDEYMQQQDAIPPLHDIVAKRNRIDPYSYQYEMLLSEELQFSQVEGFAADYLHGNEFDAEGFAARWREERVHIITAQIARHVMGIDDLTTQPALKQALLEAYRAGQAAPVTNE